MTHDVSPADGWYSLVPHPTQLPLPAPDTLAGSHCTGVVVPAVHAAPAGQSAQSPCDVAPAVPFQVPAGQSSAADARSSQYAPAGHPAQAVAPLDDWKLPASHASHDALLAAANEPGVQVLGALDPCSHAVPAGHAAQSACDAPPAVSRNVPGSHSVTELAPAPHQPPAPHASHAVALDDDWYSPAAQSAHTLSPPEPVKPPGAHAIGVTERAGQ